MKYFTKEVKIALMAIVAVILLFIGINFLKGINVFVSSNTYYVKFKDIQGLSVSNAVYANGYPVGIVRDIEYDYRRNNSVTVGIELDNSMTVPKGTKAELESELMGGVTMNLILGPNPAQLLSPGDTITGGIYQGALDKAGNLIPVLENMLPKLDSILANLNRLTADPALAQTLHNTAELTANLKTTSEGLNRMMASDIPQMVGRLNRISGNMEKLSGKLADVDVEATMNSVNATLDGVNRLTTHFDNVAGDLHHKMNAKDNTLGLMLSDRQLFDNLNHTVQSADSLLIDLKAHPKRYVHFSVFGKK